MDLLLIRHALPERVKVEGRPADPPLSPLGHRQAMAMATWLSHEHIDALYTSPLRRARETAQPLAAITRLDPIVSEGLAEFDRNAESYVPIEELKATNDPRWQQMVAGEYFELGAGMTQADFMAGVASAVDRIIADHRSETVAVVCHGGVINAAVGRVLGIADPIFFEPTYTGISRIRASSRGHRMIVTVNETPHLRGLV